MRYLFANLTATLALLAATTLARACPPAQAAALVDDAYLRFLHRLPDPDGRDNFVRHLRRGMPLHKFHAEILGSTEYYQLHGLNPPAFVAGLYEDVLGRAPTPEEINGWLSPRHRWETRTRFAEEFLRAARRELASRPPVVLQAARPDPAPSPYPLDQGQPPAPGSLTPPGNDPAPPAYGDPTLATGSATPPNYNPASRPQPAIRPLAQLLQRSRLSPRP